MNILILSCGTRNKIVQYIKRELNGTGNVVATDMSPNAPALYEADKHYIVPRMTAPGYLDVIYDICKKEQITGVFSLIDPELSLLALHEQEFKNLGVTIIGSSYELCERTLDKWKMFQWLTAHGYDCAESYVDKEVFYKDVAAKKQNYPVFVKPVRGSASIAISKAEDQATVDLLFDHADGLLIQEYLKGQEIGADCYIDMISGEVSSLILGASEETELSASALSDGIIIGELEIHPKSRKVLQKGSEISLTPKEFDILYFLAQNRGEVFTKEQIYRAVWEDDYLLDDSNIMAFIRKLRKKIEPDPDAPKYILTIWGIGYKFNDQL